MNSSNSSISRPKSLRDPRLTAINFVADAVNRTLDLREIAKNALDAILASMKVDACAVSIWQESDQALHMFAWHGLKESFMRRLSLVRKGEDSDIDTVLSGQSIIIDDLMANTSGLGGEAVRAGFRSAVLAPVRGHGKVLGVLGLGTYQIRRFDEADVDLVEVISNQIGNAMEHAQLQAEVRASEEQYRTLVEGSDNAIYIADASGRPRFANSAFSRVLGYSLSEVSQATLLRWVHPDDVNIVRRSFNQLLQGESIHNLEFRFCRKDGVWIDLQCSASVFSREGPRVLEAQFIVRDITQARQRQQQLLRRNRQLVALTMLAEVANSSLKIDEIARNTLEVALESTGMSGAGIYLLESNHEWLQLYVHIGLPEGFVRQSSALKWGEGVPGAVVASGKALVLGDMDSQPPPSSSVTRTHGFRAAIAVPIKAKGELLGVLGLLNRLPVEFAPEVVEMVTAMGNQLGIALANARLYEMQIRENEKLTALVDISSGSAQQLELETWLQRILQRAGELLDADAGFVVRYDGATEQAVIVAATADFMPLVNAHYPATEGLFDWIGMWRQGKILSPQEMAEHGFHANVKLLATDVRSTMVAPLISRSELIGALILMRLRDAAEFTRENLELLEAFASRAAVAIDNAQLLKDLGRKNELLQLLIEEAHHRIKNNLQMVSGLLQLDTESLTGGASAHFLRTAAARIQAIAQVHELLSEEMPEKVDLQTLMGKIADTMTNSASASTPSPVMIVNVDHLWLDAEQAVPLALIVNELLFNSLAHGRPLAGRPLDVRIECHPTDGECELVVSDNGGGFREPNWQQAAGHGMNIVRQLAQVNLRGQFRAETRAGGVRAELRFKMVSQEREPSSRSGPA
ncbi:MAG TPA: GAF domain-containing protein [Verrucomicrobiae bacterium]|nr:GAF domain-containing protein [Verrucomicrobiae bacterium]